MQSIRFTLSLIAILGLSYLVQAHPLSSREALKSSETTDLALPGSHETTEVALPDVKTTDIDTLGESNGRVKRQGGGCGCCGCGCGCCCCRPRCCCCCRRCCTCCRFVVFIEIMNFSIIILLPSSK